MPNSASSYAETSARPWRQVDAQRWVDTRLPWWLRPGWPAALLVAAGIAATAQTPDSVCSVQAPCGEQWFDAVGTMLILPYLLALFALPELAVATAPLLVLYSADPREWVGGTGEKISVGVVILALCWGCSVAAARLLARRRQRVLVREAAGGLTALAPVAEDDSPRRRGLIRLVAAALMCAAGAGLIASVVAEDRAIDGASRSSAVLDVPVVAYSSDDYTLTVRLPAGRRHTFDVNGSYQGDSTVRVLVHGQSVRLASEPYGDHVARQALGLGLAGLGLVTGVSGLLARRRAVALSRAEVSVLNVQARKAYGYTEVFAFDDPVCLRAVLHYATGDKTSSPLGQATVYGPLSEGGTLVLAHHLGGSDGVRHTEAALSPIVPAPRMSTDLPDRPSRPRPPSRQEAEQSRAMEALTQAAMTRMTPTGPPVRWKAGPAARWAGVMLIVLEIAICAALADGSGWWPLLPAAAVACVWLNGIRRLMTWAITADADGLHLRCLWSSSQFIPWNVAGAARYSRRGELDIARNDMADEIRIGVAGCPFAERRLRRPGRAAAAAAEITAMIRDPRLRPTVAMKWPN